MNLVEAIKSRKSIRGFKPDPVPREVLEQLLEVARWSPSGVNAQPWDFVVLSGEVFQAVKRALLEQDEKGIEQHPVLERLPQLGACRERQVSLGKQLFGVLEIGREDAEKRRQWSKKGMRFFDSPAAILVCIDKANGLDQMHIFDTGLITQTIALAALHFGLGTCIQRAVVGYPEVIAKVAGIPESKMPIIGISIGYPDWDLPVNQMRSPREPVSAITIWRTSLSDIAPQQVAR